MFKSSSEKNPNDSVEPVGLGTMLRQFVEILDRGSEAHYRKHDLDTRARYTPLLRALGDGPVTVTDLCVRAHVTQGAVSQSVKLMEAEGLVERVAGEDGRSRAVALTPKGVALHARLVPQWQARLQAVDELEHEIDAPLRNILAKAIRALERESFDRRISRAEEPEEPHS